MRLTVVGSGDAFGSGGRFNTCFFIETAKGTLLLDCGASSLVALKARGLDPNRIDGIVLSHLHGDHFGALALPPARCAIPRRVATGRSLIAGPPGTRARLDQALEVFFPLSTKSKWRFPLGGGRDRARPRRPRFLGTRSGPPRSSISRARPRPRCGSSDGKHAPGLFRRYRMDRGAGRRRRGRRSLHLRVLLP